MPWPTRVLGVVLRCVFELAAEPRPCQGCYVGMPEVMWIMWLWKKYENSPAKIDGFWCLVPKISRVIFFNWSIGRTILNWKILQAEYHWSISIHMKTAWHTYLDPSLCHVGIHINYYQSIFSIGRPILTQHPPSGVPCPSSKMSSICIPRSNSKWR